MRIWCLSSVPGLVPERAPDPQALAGWGQTPIDRRRRHGDELVPSLAGKGQLPEPLQGLDALGHERSQALAAQAPERRPHVLQGRLEVLSVANRAHRPSARRRGTSACLTKRPPGVVAVPPGEAAQLVQDSALLTLGTSRVAPEHLLGDRLALFHRKPHRSAPSLGRRRGRSGHFRGHPLVRQRSGFADISRESTRTFDGRPDRLHALGSAPRMQGGER